jgi:menaquinone-dependent protoporphyrinogen oxidase
MAAGDEARKQLANLYPAELVSAAVAKDYLGGEFNFEKMNFIYRAIIKKMAKTDKSQANYVQENIDRFAEQMNKAQ